jgi:hypothetical protein
VKPLDSILDWDELVSALRDELQEKGGLIRLLNQQTEALYRRDHVENERLEDQIRNQIRLATRCRQTRDLILRQTAAKLDMPDDPPAGEILARFPEYVQPLLEALFLEVDRLSGRLEERLRQNQQLKERFMVEIAPVT